MSDDEQAPPGTLLIRLGPLCYHVPEWNARFTGSGLPLPGLGHSQSPRATTFQFSNAELVRTLPGYEMPRTVQGWAMDGLSALTFLPTAEDARVVSENEKRRRRTCAPAR